MQKNTIKKPKKKKGHGRTKSEDYTAAKDVECKREDLTHGAACPDNECEGSVYRQSDPGNIIRITGGSLVSATRYKLERYRCNLCNTVFSARLPKGVSSSEKYDAKAKAVVTLNRIQMGIPMYRQEKYQAQIGVPLPQSTQWDLIESVANSVSPVYDALITKAAQGSLFYIDDTWARILEVIQNNKKASKKSEKKGMHTTGIISEVDCHRIILCPRRAGNN